MTNVVKAFPTTPESSLSPEVVEKMKNQVKLLNEGFVVHISDVTKSEEESNYISFMVTLLSEVNRMNVIGEVELKFSKQSIPRLKHHINKVS